MTEPPPAMETLSSDLRQIVNDSKFSDCQFLLEGKLTVYAHKAIICARSDYFRAVFSEKSESMSRIQIEKVSHMSFMAVMYYLYTNNLPVNPYPNPPYDTISLMDVWRVADKFRMEGLKRLATHMINTMINEGNVVDTYAAAGDNLPVIEDVRNSCMVFISENLQTVVNSQSFTQLPKKMTKELIKKAKAKLK